MPEELVKFWMGHSKKKSVTDQYSKLSEDSAYRLEEAGKIGTGFTIPLTMKPKAPKFRRKETEPLAA